MLNLKLRQILQFANMPFYGVPILQSETSETKIDVTEYSGAHGGYVAIKEGGPFFKTTSIDIEAFVSFEHIPKRDYGSFIEWAYSELTSGVNKLWAVNEYGELMYCNAVLKSKSWRWEATRNYDVRLNLSFTNLDGVWTIADTRKVFVADKECSCKMYACQACIRQKDCDTPAQVKKDCAKCSGCASVPCCNFAWGQTPLCNWKGDIFKRCGKPPRFFYSCEESKRVFGATAEYGYKIDIPATSDLVTFTICVDTPICTTNGAFTISGSFTDPTIWIENYKMRLVGVFNGDITFNSSTNQVFYKDTSLQWNPVTEITSQITVDTTIPFFRICKGNTTVTVSGHNVGSPAYVYYDVERKTI